MKLLSVISLHALSISDVCLRKCMCMHASVYVVCACVRENLLFVAHTYLSKTFRCPNICLYTSAHYNFIDC